jgi:homoserine dehydrogenase
VVADIVEISRNIRSAAKKRVSSLPEIAMAKRLVPMEEIETRYYLRFTVIDRPGVLARISTILGENNISISAVTQRERHAESAVPIMALTHSAKESSIRTALAKIDSLDVVKYKSAMIRIEGGD